MLYVTRMLRRYRTRMRMVFSRICQQKSLIRLMVHFSNRPMTNARHISTNFCQRQTATFFFVIFSYGRHSAASPRPRCLFEFRAATTTKHSRNTEISACTRVDRRHTTHEIM